MFASAPATEAPGIPNGLATMPPGPVLASFLSAIDVRLLTGHDRVLVLRAHHRMAAHYQAQAYDDMAALAEHFEGQGDDPELAHDSTAAEVRAGLCWTRRAADNAVALARDLSDRIPAVAKALEGGDIDLPRVRVLASGTSHLNDDTARAVVDAVIAGAHRMTTGQLAARLRKLCAEAQPAEASNRYTRALQQRRIVGVPSPDGTCHLLGMDLPPDRVTAVMRRIDEIALSLRGDGETRSMDQLRAEVFLDLLSGTRTGGKGAVVDIRVGLSTLAELDDHSGDLAGFGPVIADIARQVVATQPDAEWRFSVDDPATGRPLTTGTTSRRPTARLRRFVEARDGSCIFPGCRMPARQTDADHGTPWAEGGVTTASNLALCCRHDHYRIRHGCGWTYLRLDNGDYQWTSRLGHTYTTSGRSP